MKKTKVKNKGVFPLEHLSPSSVTLLEKSEKLWIAKYIYGEKGFTSKHMEFGREAADFFDDDVYIECILKRGKQRLKVIGYLDNLKGNMQFENKTGLKCWTEKQVKDSFQLKTYAMIHEKNTGVIPHQVLTWRGTDMFNGQLVLTGHSRAFDVKQTTLILLETESRYWKAHDRIIEITKKEHEKI